MEELFASLLSALAEFFLELVVQLLFEVVLDFAIRWLRSELAKLPYLSAILSGMGYFLIGVVAGFFSVLAIPHPIVHPSRFHGISLLLSPLATGLAMSLIGRLIRRQGKETVRIESFNYGFTFAFGMALVRLYFTRG